VFFNLNDIDAFLGVTRLNGIDKERTKDNYTIHHILNDYNITPYGLKVNNHEYLFLKLPQLIEFCDKHKTKRSLILQEALENNIVEQIGKYLKNKNKKLLTITA
jgi:hypothetical protein